MKDLHLKLRAAVADELPNAIALRHRLHADPRVSGDEAGTTAEVVRTLDAGPGHEAAGTGRVIRIGDDGPAVALRAELDALPITERTGVPWASQRDAMHACASVGDSSGCSDPTSRTIAQAGRRVTKPANSAAVALATRRPGRRRRR